MGKLRPVRIDHLPRAREGSQWWRKGWHYKSCLQPYSQGSDRTFTRPIHVGAAGTKLWHLKTCHRVRKKHCSQTQLPAPFLSAHKDRVLLAESDQARHRTRLKSERKTNKSPSPSSVWGSKSQRLLEGHLLSWAAQDILYSTCPFASKQSYQQKGKIKASLELQQQEALEGSHSSASGSPLLCRRH